MQYLLHTARLGGTQGLGSGKMRIFGNLHSRLMETSKQEASVVVGMGCTITMYSDRHAATVTDILTANKIVV